jgi:hypothetical protein
MELGQRLSGQQRPEDAGLRDTCSVRWTRCQHLDLVHRHIGDSSMQREASWPAVRTPYVHAHTNIANLEMVSLAPKVSGF